MASVKGRFEYPDDLTPGHSKDGGLHHNLYDDQKNLVGHAKFIPDDENEEDPPTEPPPLFFNTNKCDCESDSQVRERLDPEEIVEALIILIKFAEWTAPRLKDLWNAQALPFIKSTRNRFARTRKTDSPDTPSESATLIESTSSDSPQEVIAKLEEDQVSMSSEEASARFAAALMARLFSDEQMRILRSARIEDEGDSLELSTAENPTRQKIAENVRLILEANPSLLTNESLAELGKLLARIQSRPSI
ncbi:hypothetical protein [Streptomyces scabiei]|uniref:hypothetical protein n=1 Tax=Streptomyces scabiei TaxID=1930 RepID=UPI00117DC126|nr:hypothetical protein [Streptomyces scabiei]